MEAGVKELRDRLSHYLSIVRAGQEVTVTDRGKAVARLVPRDQPRALDRLVAEGLVTPAPAPRGLAEERAFASALADVTRAPGRDRFARRTRAPRRMLHASPSKGANYRKGPTMHALLISFTSAAPLDALAEPFTDYAHALRDVPGLISKTWIFDGTTVGGFYTFTTAADIDAYLAGALWTSVATNPAFSGFRFERFGIVDELTALTSPDALAPRAA